MYSRYSSLYVFYVNVTVARGHTEDQRVLKITNHQHGTLSGDRHHRYVEHCSMSLL